MKVHVGQLKREIGLDESHSFEYSMPAVSDSGDQVKFENPLSVHATLINTGESILASISATGSAKLRCGRCLGEYEIPVSTDFRVEFRESGASGGDDEDVTYYSNDIVDLGEETRQNVILSLPMRPLCDESCKGLCPVCGMNLNKSRCSCDRGPENIAMAGLRELLEKRDGE